LQITGCGLRIVVLLALGLVAGRTSAQDRPAEEDRFDSAAFHNALRQRGLNELLELHLREFPPRHPESLLLLKRQVKLATYADQSLPEDARYAALHEANNLLEDLIAIRSIDPRRHQWRFELARSLIFEEAEPFIARILLLGGNADDRRQLGHRAARAVSALDTLKKEIETEFARLDAMPIREYERIEQSGRIDRLESVKEESDYLALWVLYYDALARGGDDPVRVRRLEAVLGHFEQESWLIETPHEETHVQAQSLLLAGMACRLLGFDDDADRHLGLAVRVAQRIGDPRERQSLGYVALRGTVERSRALIHKDREDKALAVLRDFRQHVAGSGGDDFRVRLVLAMAERSVHKALAEAARRKGDISKSREHQARATGVLLRLCRSDAGNRDKIYDTLYDLVGRDADPAKLDTIERAALMACLLRDSGQPEQDAATFGRSDPARAAAESAANLLERVIVIGETVAREKPTDAPELIPEIIFNLAVAQSRRGDRAEAVRRFLDVARDYPAFPDATRAAVLAVQTAHELRSDAGSTAPTVGGAGGVSTGQDELYLQALATLVTGRGSDPAARYWQFFYAQALEEAGRFRDAADQYLLVDPLHERALEAMCFRARSLASALARRSTREPEAVVANRREANEILDVLRGFSAKATEAPAQASGERKNELVQLLAESKLITAEIHLLPQIARPSRALETLAGFEELFPQAKRLVGRVLSIRMRACEKLGRCEEAAKLLPRYVSADPAGAGATLQPLYLDLADEIEHLRRSGRQADAKPKAELAAQMARQIYDWAIHRSETAATRDRPGQGIDLRGLKLQLAEAHLMNDEPAQAKVLFEECGAREAAAGKSGDARAVMGLAECFFQMEQYAQALPMFNKLAMELPGGEPLRWKALLRDLQCRDELKHDPRGIIKAIQNQQANPHYTDPESGGRFAPELEHLLRECRRRADGD